MIELLPEAQQKSASNQLDPRPSMTLYTGSIAQRPSNTRPWHKAVSGQTADGLVTQGRDRLA